MATATKTRPFSTVIYTEEQIAALEMKATAWVGDALFRFHDPDDARSAAVEILNPLQYAAVGCIGGGAPSPTAALAHSRVDKIVKTLFIRAGVRW